MNIDVAVFRRKGKVLSFRVVVFIERNSLSLTTIAPRCLTPFHANENWLLFQPKKLVSISADESYPRDQTFAYK